MLNLNFSSAWSVFNANISIDYRSIHSVYYESDCWDLNLRLMYVYRIRGCPDCPYLICRRFAGEYSALAILLLFQRISTTCNSFPENRKALFYLYTQKDSLSSFPPKRDIKPPNSSINQKTRCISTESISVNLFIRIIADYLS